MLRCLPADVPLLNVLVGTKQITDVMGVVARWLVVNIRLMVDFFCVTSHQHLCLLRGSAVKALWRWNTDERILTPLLRGPRLRRDNAAHCA